MAYRPKHFKIHTSIQNHCKTIGLFDDDSLLAMYVRIGILAVERFADRTNDSFLVSPRDLERLAGCRGVANARRKLGRLEATSRLTVCQEGAGYRVGFPNFKRKQGFQSQADPQAVLKRTASSTPTTTPTTTSKRESTRTPAEPKTACPETLPDPHRSDAIKWANGIGLDASELAFRWERVRRWSDQNPSKLRTAKGWYSTLRNAVEDRWGGDPNSNAPQDESPAQGRQRRTREAAVDALKILETREAERKLELVAGGNP